MKRQSETKYRRWSLDLNTYTYNPTVLWINKIHILVSLFHIIITFNFFTIPTRYTIKPLTQSAFHHKNISLILWLEVRPPGPRPRPRTPKSTFMCPPSPPPNPPPSPPSCVFLLVLTGGDRRVVKSQTSILEKIFFSEGGLAKDQTFFRFFFGPLP